MARTESYRPSPPAVQRVVSNQTVDADLHFLEIWEASRSMNLGLMLRIRQIRRANPQLPRQRGGTNKLGRIAMS